MESSPAVCFAIDTHVTELRDLFVRVFKTYSLGSRERDIRIYAPRHTRRGAQIILEYTTTFFFFFMGGCT